MIKNTNKQFKIYTYIINKESKVLVLSSAFDSSFFENWRENK